MNQKKFGRFCETLSPLHLLIIIEVIITNFHFIVLHAFYANWTALWPIFARFAILNPLRRFPQPPLPPPSRRFYMKRSGKILRIWMIAGEIKWRRTNNIGTAMLATCWTENLGICVMQILVSRSDLIGMPNTCCKHFADNVGWNLCCQLRRKFTLKCKMVADVLRVRWMNALTLDEERENGIMQPSR